MWEKSPLALTRHAEVSIGTKGCHSYQLITEISKYTLWSSIGKKKSSETQSNSFWGVIVIKAAMKACLVYPKQMQSLSPY